MLVAIATAISQPELMCVPHFLPRRLTDRTILACQRAPPSLVGPLVLCCLLWHGRALLLGQHEPAILRSGGLAHSRLLCQPPRQVTSEQVVRPAIRQMMPMGHTLAWNASFALTARVYYPHAASRAQQIRIGARHANHLAPAQGHRADSWASRLLSVLRSRHLGPLNSMRATGYGLRVKDAHGEGW